MNKKLRRAGRPLYHKLSDVSAVQAQAHKLYWSARFRHWCRANPCPELSNREELYESIVRSEGLEGAIDYLEFGVWEGNVLRWWTSRNRDPGSAFFGFDSFEGLPEEWDGNPVGTFSTQGKVPDIADPRFHVVKGYFKDTVPGWIKGHDLSRKLVAHLDADLYSSTLLVLVHLLPWLKPGDVVVFDEFHGFMHEFRAFCDALSACPREFRALARTKGPGPDLEWAQVALRVVS